MKVFSNMKSLKEYLKDKAKNLEVVMLEDRGFNVYVTKRETNDKK